MISDVLSDAQAEIERYLREFPGTYEGVRHRIDTLTRLMQEVREELDAPPRVPIAWFIPAHDGLVAEMHASPIKPTSLSNWQPLYAD